MHKRIMFRCMAHSKAIEDYISNKVTKLYKFFKRQSSPISIDIILEPHRGKKIYKVACVIHSSLYHINMQSQGMDMYMVIDEIMKKIIKDIVRKKEKNGRDFHLSYAA